MGVTLWQIFSLHYPWYLCQGNLIVCLLIVWFLRNKDLCLARTDQASRSVTSGILSTWASSSEPISCGVSTPLALLNDLSSSSTFGAFQFSNTANFKSLACAHFVIPLNWSAIMNVNGLGLSTILTTSYLIPGHRFSYWSGQPIVTLFEVFRCFYFVLFLFFYLLLPPVYGLVLVRVHPLFLS